MARKRDWYIQEDCQSVINDSYQLISQLKDSCLLITGGTGYMGTWLTELVVQLNDHYGFNIKLILLSSHANSFNSRVPHLAHRSDVTLIERDIRYIDEIPNEVNWIIHAAGSPDNRFHASDPVQAIDVIVNGTSALLSAAVRASGLVKILNISSGLVYGPQQQLKQESISEGSWRPFDPNTTSSIYAEAKRCSEALLAAYRSEHRLSIVNARPFSFVGPYQLLDKPWAINNFFRDYILGGPIRILGHPNTTRSYMYGSDLAFWLLRILVAGQSGASFDVGSPEGITMLELAKKINTSFGHEVKIQSPSIPGESLPKTKFVPDVSSAHQVLGLSIKIDLDTAIRHTLWWHQASQCRMTP